VTLQISGKDDDIDGGRQEEDLGVVDVGRAGDVSGGVHSF